MITETIEVSGCDGCLCASSYTGNDGYEYYHCSAQKNTERSEEYLFDTCPLKKSSITIKLKQNEPEGN